MHNESNHLIGKEEKVLRKQKLNIMEELEGYSPHPALGVKTFAELVPELGGTPVRTLVVSSWRSGSSFFGSILGSHPATFYHFEPLITSRDKIKTEQERELAVTMLRELFNCNYAAEELEDYLERARTTTFMHQNNKRLWWVSDVDRTLFRKPAFLSNFCSLFPIHVAKVVRLPLEVAEPLLEEQSLSLKVVLLVRDPRAVVESRHRQDWCVTDCASQALHCEGLVRDYQAAVKLTERFPGRVRVIRYEDLQLDPLKGTKDLFEFLALNFSRPVEEFLRKNTKFIGKRSDPLLAPNSKDGSLKWRSKLSFKQVDQIQKDCATAMDLFGYALATSKDDLRYFSPTKTVSSLSLMRT